MKLRGKLDLYDTFFWVTMCGSFYAAQGVLHKSRATIKRHIDSLEEDLGFPLFERFHDGVELTKDGEKLFEAVHKMRRELFTVENELKRTHRHQ